MLKQYGKPKRTKRVFECTICAHSFVSEYQYHGTQHDGCPVRATDGNGAGYWFQSKMNPDEWSDEYNYTIDDHNFDAAREDSIFGKNG